jgi:hypothetical protein
LLKRKGWQTFLDNDEDVEGLREEPVLLENSNEKP